MNITLGTVIGFVFLLPGYGFVFGVDAVNRNAAELVFRSDRSRDPYIVVVSLAIHFWLILLSIFLYANFPHLISEYNTIIRAWNSNNPPSFEIVRQVLLPLFAYCIVAAVSGFLPGAALGRLIALRGKSWGLTFVRHKWMLDLIQGESENLVVASVVLKNSFSIDVNRSDVPVIISGVVTDSYFSSEGTLVYLVLADFEETGTDQSKGKTLDKLMNFPANHVRDHLVIEGQNIAMVRWSIATVPIAQIESALASGRKLAT